MNGGLMRRFFLLVFFVLLIARPAEAAWNSVEGYRLDDPLARRIASTGTLEAQMLGPGYARVSVFSVPERNGSGERLFVGFVDDLWDRNSRARLWKGPVALRWRNLKPVPGHKPLLSAPNPKRYRIERISTPHGQGTSSSLMEIDLESMPPRLLLVGGGPGQPKYLDSQVLGESQTMNNSLKLLVRLSEQVTFVDGEMTLRSYQVFEGDPLLPKDRLAFTYPWNVGMDTHLLAVCKSGDPEQAAFHFLPLRPFGWVVENLIAPPSSKEGNGSFVLWMHAQYAYPNDAGELHFFASRHSVAVGLGGLSVKTLQTGLVYDSMRESWVEKLSKPPKGGY
jgi:hypothetical protein